MVCAGGIQVAGLGNGRRLVLTSLTELATGVGGLYCSADTASGLDVCCAEPHDRCNLLVLTSILARNQRRVLSPDSMS